MKSIPLMKKTIYDASWARLCYWARSPMYINRNAIYAGLRSSAWFVPLLLAVLLFTAGGVHARNLLAPSIRALLGNGIGELGTDGQYLWAGTDAGVSRLSLFALESGDWTTFTAADGLGADNITTMAVGNGEVWVAAAHDSSVMQSEVGDGISVTRDGGQTWETFRPERAFGLANTVWGLAVTPHAVWAAAWNAFGLFDSGLIRSKDGGQTWESFTPNPRDNGEFTFTVVADEPRVWVGTAGGIARSVDDGVTWTVADTADGLTGNWVFALDVQQVNGDSILWAGSWPSVAGKRYGVVRSFDDGATWTAIDNFMDIQVIDFAFVDSTVWVASFDGLWTSPDAGTTWQRFDEQDGLAEGETVSVHALGDTVWVGSSSNGLSTTTNAGAAWSVTRASFPTVALGAPAQTDTIQTYAFPNPFSPVNHGVVRIRFSLSTSADVTVDIYDVANQRVKTLLANQPRTAGE